MQNVDDKIIVTVNRGDFGHSKNNYSLFYILLPPTFF